LSVILGRQGKRREIDSVYKPKEENPILDDRLLATYARVEALQDHLQRIEIFREDCVRNAELQRQETR